MIHCPICGQETSQDELDYYEVCVDCYRTAWLEVDKHPDNKQGWSTI